MNTEIEFLRTLEEDLKGAAAREVERERQAVAIGRAPGSGGAARPAVGRGVTRRWPRVAAAAVAVLVVAGGIGFVAENGLPFGGTANNPTYASGGRNVEHQFISPQPNAAVPGGVIYGPAKQASGGGGVGAPKAASSPAPQQTSGPGADLSKIVRTGSITLQVPNGTFEKTAVPAVYGVAAHARGFVLSSSTDNQTSGTFTLRIPSRRFDQAMTELSKLGTVRASESRGQDVTSRYVDYQARLRILLGRRAVIFRLLSRATTIEQTLELQSDFDKVQLQIEQYKGQLNVLRNQVAESTITVDVAEKGAPETSPPSAVHTPSLLRSWRLAWQGFVRVVGAVIVGLGYLIPIGVIAAMLWAIAFVLRRRRRTAGSST